MWKTIVTKLAVYSEYEQQLLLCAALLTAMSWYEGRSQVLVMEVYKIK